jgi:hypothetical protein
MRGETVWRKASAESLSLQGVNILAGQGSKTPLLEQEGTTSDSESGW